VELHINRRSRVSHVRHRRRQHAVSCRQRSAPSQTLDDLYDEQSVIGLGPCPPRRWLGPRHHRSRAGARPLAHAGWSIDADQTPRTWRPDVIW